MRSLSLDVLLAGLVKPGVHGAVRVRGLSLDSRHVLPGDVFCAVKGKHTHGLQHVNRALTRGASVILWEPPAEVTPPALFNEEVPCLAVPGLAHALPLLAERFWADVVHRLRIVAITGTDGKTSTSHFVSSLLTACGVPCGLIGTLGWGQPGRLHPTHHTTPDLFSLYGTLMSLAGQGMQAVAIEASSHALDQERLGHLPIEVAVLTQQTRDHLDYHGSEENYRRAKRRLFERPATRAHVLNLDDGLGMDVQQAPLPGVRQVVFSRRDHVVSVCPDALWLNGAVSDQDGLSLDLGSTWGNARVRLPLLGAFNATNVLAACGAALAMGCNWTQLIDALPTLTPVPGRMERLGGGGLPNVVIDYAHTPHALGSVLSALRPHVNGRLLCVFGCGGDRDTGKRPLMGQVAEEHADAVWLTDDNPRSEDPVAIVAGILGGTRHPDRIRVVHDRAAAIAAALATATAQDWLLVAGKGDETTQEIGGMFLPMRDRDLVSAALEAWSC